MVFRRWPLPKRREWIICRAIEIFAWKIEMPKVLCSAASPYTSKVRMAAAYLGIALEPVQVDTSNPTGEFLKANPLGKIPVLVADDGEAIFDSRAITQYLNRAVRQQAFPAQSRQAHRRRAARSVGGRHRRLRAGSRLRAPLAPGGDRAPALARQAVEQGDACARRAERQSAEARQEDQRRAHRLAGGARLSRPALCRESGKRAGAG